MKTIKVKSYYWDDRHDITKKINEALLPYDIEVCIVEQSDRTYTIGERSRDVRLDCISALR